MGLIKPKRCFEHHLFMNDDAMIMQDMMNSTGSASAFLFQLGTHQQGPFASQRLLIDEIKSFENCWSDQPPQDSPMPSRQWEMYDLCEPKDLSSSGLQLHCQVKGDTEAFRNEWTSHDRECRCPDRYTRDDLQWPLLHRTAWAVLFH